ncbi:MAG: hypothetical protein ACK56I_09780, partial [bacterium]
MENPMKPSTPLLLVLVCSVSACETARYPNHYEFFKGQAFMSVSASSALPTLQSNLWQLAGPVNGEGDYCVVPTTDATVEAVNDYVRKGRLLAPHELYRQEAFTFEFYYSAVGSFRADLTSMILFDSSRRMVTVGEASRDFDGNYYELPDEDYDEVSTIDRLIDIDTVWRKC